MSRLKLFVLLCAAAALYQNWDAVERRLDPPPPRPPGTADHVALYATRWCGYCAKTRDFFARHHVDYQEFNVEDGGAGQRGYQKLGGGGVPIVVVNDTQVIRGYDPDALLQALGRAP